MDTDRIKESVENTAIVVSSCDAFQDCWLPFLYSLDKYGQQCPFNIYIISCTMTIPLRMNQIGEGTIRFITVGEDLGWASNLKNALCFVPEEYIIYLQEDYFLNKYVVWQEIINHVGYCIRNRVDYLRLTFPYLSGEIKDCSYVMNTLEQAYSVCLQAAVWRKMTLSALCIEGWSGWDFERNVASLIRQRFPDFSFLALSKYAKGQISYVRGTAVRKGKWTNPGYRFLKRNGFTSLLPLRAREPVYFELIDVDGILRPITKRLWHIIHSLIH